MQRTSYKLTFDELRSLMLFLRDYNWSNPLNENPVLTKFVYDTRRLLYSNLKKRGLHIIANKRIEKPVKVSLNDLELLSLSIMAKHPHDNMHINMVISKLMLELPVEIINLQNKTKDANSID